MIVYLGMIDLQNKPSAEMKAYRGLVHILLHLDSVFSRAVPT